MAENQFNPSQYLGREVEIELRGDFKTIDTKFGPRRAATCDVWVSDGDDEHPQRGSVFSDVLVFNTGILSDLAKQDVLIGRLAEVETRGVREDGSPRKAIVVR